MYLAFDMFFAIFCILLVCLIGIALCCCFPCIIVFLASAVVGHGASDADISAIPKLRFCRADTTQNFNSEEHSVAIAIEKQEHIDDLALPPEDSVHFPLHLQTSCLIFFPPKIFATPCFFVLYLFSLFNLHARE